MITTYNFASSEPFQQKLVLLLGYVIVHPVNLVRFLVHGNAHTSHIFLDNDHINVCPYENIWSHAWSSQLVLR